MSVVRRTIKDTLLAVELVKEDSHGWGNTLELKLSSGDIYTLKVINTGADVIRSTLTQLKVEEEAAKTEIKFWCDVLVNGKPYTLERELSTPRSLYEPWVIDGVRIWLDAVDDVFDYMTETHGLCRANKITKGSEAKGYEVRHKDARFALQEEGKRICPEKLALWCPLPENGLSIEDCYRGEDCWLGAYNGIHAHGGLDINHPAGTPLYAPIDLDDNFLYKSLEMGHSNNSWRGIRRWGNGSEWILQSAHMTEQTVPEHCPIKKGTQYAIGAGTHVGAVEHSHFIFNIYDDGELYLLDPWILFWQMMQDNP